VTGLKTLCGITGRQGCERGGKFEKGALRMERGRAGRVRGRGVQENQRNLRPVKKAHRKGEGMKRKMGGVRLLDKAEVHYFGNMCPGHGGTQSLWVGRTLEGGAGEIQKRGDLGYGYGLVPGGDPDGKSQFKMVKPTENFMDTWS